MKNFKNKDEIKNSKIGIRGELIEKKDKDLFYFGEKEKTFFDPIDKNDVVEFSVYKEDELLYWNVFNNYQTEIVNDNILFKPGKDLRESGFNRGFYTIVYSLFRNSIGSHDNNKVFIEEISPSRKEIRLLPVKVKDSLENSKFSKLFEDFTTFGMSRNDYSNKIKSLNDKMNLIDITRNEKINDSLFKILNDNFLQLKKQIENNINDYLEVISFIDEIEHKKIINNSVQRAFVSVYSSYFRRYRRKLMNLSKSYSYVLNSLQFVQSNKKLDFVLNFGNDEYYLILDFVRDIVTYPYPPYSIVCKLYDKLPQNIKKNTKCWISEIVTLPVVEKTFLVGPREEQLEGTFLKPANFAIEVEGVGGYLTSYESWDELLSTEPTTSEQIINQYLSGSIYGGIELNVEYTDYLNFINFGSAYERVSNFKYKLELLESYSSSLNDLLTYSASLTVSGSQSLDINNNIISFSNKINNLKNTFDGYEKWLYYETSSHYSGTLPSSEDYLYHDEGNYPKITSEEPYKTTSDTGSLWFETQLGIATRYDRENKSSLTENIPAYIGLDDNNEEYLLFLNMIGHYFDILLTYIKDLTKSSNRDESIYTGLAKDLTYNIAKSFGFNLFNGNDYVELWKYALGTIQTGSEFTSHSGSVSSSPTPYSDITKEIWRRILNNLPLLMKSKGTARSIKALMNCYGIPSTILTIREYGGPDPADFPDINQKSAYLFEDFIYAIELNGTSNYVSSSWKNYGDYSNKPGTLEIRFSTTASDLLTQSIVDADGAWEIKLYQTGSSDYGRIAFFIGGTEISSSDYRFFDGDFYSIILTTSASDSHSLYVKKSEGDRIIYQSSASLPYDSNYSSNQDLYIGGDGGSTNFFRGKLQEFKLFQPMLSESVFNNHIRYPKAYNSNDPTNTYDELVLKYSFDNPKNHHPTYGDQTVTDVKANQDFSTNGVAMGFNTNEIHYAATQEEFGALTPLIGSGRLTNKIRIEDNALVFGKLDHQKRSELSSYDGAPLDSNKLGIFFSPLEAINRDIMATFAGYDLADYVGDPRDVFQDKYSDLNELRKTYFRKYTSGIDFNKFLRIISYYDKSFFDVIKSFIPARANEVVGSLVESHILERSKVKWTQPNIYKLEHSESINGITKTFDLNESCITGSYRKTNVLESEHRLIDTIANNTLPLLDFATLILTQSLAVTDETPSNYNIGDLWERDGVFSMIETTLLSGRSLADKRLKYTGIFNTIDTTIDGKDPVEINFSNPNKLRTTDQGPSKLTVE